MWARACAWYECAHVALMARCHTSVCSTAAHSTAHRDVDAVDVECFDLRGALEEGDGPSGEGGRGLGGWGRVSVLREHSGGRRRRHGRQSRPVRGDVHGMHCAPRLVCRPAPPLRLRLVLALDAHRPGSVQSAGRHTPSPTTLPTGPMPAALSDSWPPFQTPPQTRLRV